MDQKKTIYLSGLNGIRAIAALGVMISHINMDLSDFNIHNFSLFGYNKSHIQNAWNLGEQGVTMFFVLSGFLITYLLLLEREKTGTISKKNFYIRRILRIWPLYFFYLALASSIYFLFKGTELNTGNLLLYIFMLANIPFIFSGTLPLSTHLWSIAVEEQFYLFWPHCFKKITSRVNILVIVIISAIIFRIILWALYPFKPFTIFFTVNRFDCMLFGGLMAIYQFKKSKIIGWVNTKLIQSFAWIVILTHVINYEFINSIISMELVTLSTGIIIIGQINIKNRLINLENKFFNFMGKYSYGIYIYHPLIIFLMCESKVFIFIENETFKSILVMLSIICITIITAFISFELFEKRFIQLKGRFSIIYSTNSK